MSPIQTRSEMADSIAWKYEAAYAKSNESRILKGWRATNSPIGVAVTSDGWGGDYDVIVPISRTPTVLQQYYECKYCHSMNTHRGNWDHCGGPQGEG